MAPAYGALMAETRRGLDVRGKVGANTENTGPRRRMNSEDCLPTGLPNMRRYPFAFEFLYTPGRVTIRIAFAD